MSHISCDPSLAAQGSLLRSDNLNNKLFDQTQLALAVHLGLNGPQLVKERALHNVLTSKSARGDIKQILQSRAEIYRDELDPNYSLKIVVIWEVKPGHCCRGIKRDHS